MEFVLFCRKKGPNIQANKVVPKSKPIVKLIVLVGRRANAIGIPRNEVLPIKPANCKAVSYTHLTLPTKA